MNANLTLVRRATLGLSLAAALVLAGCASGPPATPPEVIQRIDTARTRADHESLAAYYVQQAGKARDSAAEHRKMATRYSGQASIGQKGPSMAAHCNAVVQSAESMATSYDAMAASHREMAAEVRQ